MDKRCDMPDFHDFEKKCRPIGPDKRAPRPFKAWVQRVLPQVYNDALSYEELLYRVLWFVNELVDVVDETQGDNEETREQWEELKAWIKKYFDGIDIRCELEAILDDMIRTGDFGQILWDYLLDNHLIEYGSGIKFDFGKRKGPNEGNNTNPGDWPNPNDPTQELSSDCGGEKSKDDCGCNGKKKKKRKNHRRLIIRSDIAQGSGIAIDPPSSDIKGTQIIRTDIKQGNGIFITPGSSDKGGTQIIETDLNNGSGIVINPTTGPEGGSQNIRTDFSNGSGIVINPPSSETPGTQNFRTDFENGSGIIIDPESSETPGTQNFHTDFSYGTGIIINPPSSKTAGTQNFRTNFTYSDGIKISPDSSESPSAQNFACNFNEGDGIVITHNSDGSLTFSTEYPLLNMYGAYNYSRLSTGSMTPGDGYDANSSQDAWIYWFGNWYASDTVTDMNAISNGWSGQDTRGHLLTRVARVYDKNGQLALWKIRITQADREGQGDYYCPHFKGNICDSSLFRMATPSTEERDNILAVYFPPSSSYAECSEDKWELIDDHDSWNFWSIRNSSGNEFGASWLMNLQFRNNTYTDVPDIGVGNREYYVLRPAPGAYADGYYENDLSHWGSGYTVREIDIDATFTFVRRDLV